MVLLSLQVETVECKDLKLTTAQCPCCNSRFKWDWDKQRSKNRLAAKLKSDLVAHFKICTAANGTPSLSSAYKEVQSEYSAKRQQKICEQAGRTYRPSCGPGNGERVDGLELYMDSFTKTKLQDIIKYVPIHLRLWFFGADSVLAGVHRSVVDRLGPLHPTKKKVWEACAKLMTTTIRGRTVKCSQRKAMWTFFWRLDAGWTYGGKVWGARLGYRPELRANTKGELSVVQVPVGDSEEED